MPITAVSYSTAYGPLTLSGVTCALWMDAADTSTMTTSGTTITRMNDKSGNAYNTTVIGGAPALTANAINGLSAISFNGSSYMTGCNANTTTTGTYFVVATLASGQGAAQQYTSAYVFGRAVSGSACYNEIQSINGLACQNVATSLALSPQRNNGNGPIYTLSNYNTAFMHTTVCNGTTMAGYGNGNSVGTTSSSGNFAYTFYNIGSQTSQAVIFYNYNWTGYIGEVIAFNNALSDAQRQTIEGYLAQKWGLTANLPAGHPGLTQTTLYNARAYQSRIPITLTPYTSLYTLTYTGSYITYTVPTGITSLTFYMWGGGGSGGNNQPGGGGAYLTGRLTTVPGETLRIIVGRGGSYGTATYSNAMPDTDGAGGGGGGSGGQGGQGGGRTAIQKYISNTWTEIITAGGGGSSGGNANTYGGNAYYTGTSQSGGSTYGQGRIPTGGSSTAGGLGTFSVNVGTPWDGTQFLGGSASNAFNVSPVTGACGGGGGGGGYYGGGGGGRSGADTYGGGGGGSYYNATYVSNFSGSNGNATTANATNITGYVTGSGVAGQAGSVYNGSNGLVVLNLAYTKVPLTLTPYISFDTSAASSTNGIYTVLTFAYPGGTLVAMKPITVTYLVIGGGGGGAGGGSAYQTGGGGAGGAVYVSSSTALPAGSYAVTVGVGGSPGQVGGNSVFNGSTGYGGGYGGGWINGAGSSGGCGGGGSGEGGSGAAGTQGFGGGSGRSQNTAGGGGGGMGSAGSTPNGGNGLQYSITGTAIYYAGGGGGNGGGGLGGSGGGGNATLSGTNGLGGGGGGGGGSGGHGTVIISYVFT